MSLLTESTHKYRPYNYRNQVRRRILAFFLVIIFLFLAYIIVDHFLISSFAVKNEGMEPYLSIDDRVLATPLLYGPKIPFANNRIRGFSSPRRGDIVIAEAGYADRPPVIYRILDTFIGFFTFQKVQILENRSFSTPDPLVIKRILGLPGDTIRMDEYVMYIKPEGNKYFFHESELITGPFDILTEPLPEGWDDSFILSDHFDEVTLGSDEYFLIGDNRSASLDSRHWGPVPGDHLLKRVVLKYWPFKEFNAP